MAKVCAKRDVIMEDIILISYLNDYIFCPVSIYFHKLYGNVNKEVYQSTVQIEGTNAHEAIDNSKYSTKVSILQGTEVFTEEFGILGKIDTFDIEKRVLTERKKKVKQIYDGYAFQVYAQYYALVEMGFKVERIKIYSMDDNKNYNIDLPKEDVVMDNKFRTLIKEIRNFNIENFEQTNPLKCKNCIYEPSCDRSKIC